MSPEQNLNQITNSFYITEIQNTLLLFHIDSGEVSSLNNSAALFINLAQTGLSDKEITLEVSKALSIPETQIQQDLANLQSHLAQIKSPKPSHIETDQMAIADFKAGPYSKPEKTSFYQVGNIEFQINFPDLESYEICNSILSSLSIAPLSEAEVKIEVHKGLNGWAVLLDGEIQYAMEDSASIADLLRTLMLDTIGSKLVNWIGLHAAGILNQTGEVLLLAAPSGSGKSTLTIELVLNGFGYFGDDTQILDLDKQEIWPFPTAANLKPGSWELFNSRLPELDKIPIYRAETRPVKFLPIKLDLNTVNQAYKTKALVFPEYSADAEGRIKKVDLADRIQLLSDSGCYSKVKASAEMSQKYMEYILSLEAYQLTYSSSQQAIKLLKEAELLA